jgi:hypothetical protein
MKRSVILISLLLFIFSSVTFAVVNQNNENKVNNLKNINKIMEYIKLEINDIDKKIIESRKMQEFIEYPAIRLNIDTPYFGIKSIIESKLNIKNNVATVDLASGYSIRDVINKKSIKIETFGVGNVIVSTKDVKIDEKLSDEDIKIITFKLVEYLEQAKSANNFLNKQLYNIYIGYINQEKNDKVVKIKERIYNIENDINMNILKNMTIISMFTDIDISEYFKYYLDVNDKLYNYKKDIKNILITDDKLDNINNSLNNIENQVKTIKLIVDEKYNILNLDIEKSYYKIREIMSSDIKYIEEYIKNSKKDIEYTDQVDIYKEIKEVYKITQENSLESMKQDLKKLDEILLNVIYENLLTANNNSKIEDLTSYKKQKIEELYSLYTSFLNKQVVFFSENLKVNLTNIKQNYVNCYSDNFEYIYIFLSKELIDINDKFDKNNILNNVDTTNKFKYILNILIDYIKIEGNIDDKVK